MKLTDLKRAVTLATKLTTRGTRPVLGGLLLSPDGIRATDLETEVEIGIPDLIDLPRVVDARALGKILRSFKGRGAEVELRSSADGVRVCRVGTAVSVHIASLVPPEEFPVSSFLGSDAELQGTDTELRTALKRIVSTATTDPTRFQMHGALLTVRRDGVRMVSTDGKRMGVQDLDMNVRFADVLDDEFSVILSLPALTIIERALPKDAPFDSRIDVSRQGIEIETADRVRIRSRAVEGTFPNYKHAIPGGPFEVTQRLPVESMIGAVEIAKAGTTPGTMSVGFEFRGKELRIFSGTTTEPNAEASVSLAEHTVDFDIFFNPGYVLDLLKTCGGEELEASFRDHKSAALFSLPGYRQIIMPLVVQK